MTASVTYRNHPARMRSLAALAALVVAVEACSEPTAPVRRNVLRVDPAWVTGEAAAGVDPATGLFVLAPPTTRELPLAAAESAAVAYIRFSLNPGTIGNARATLEAYRGAPVAAWDRLVPCGRTMLAQSPFAPAPTSAPRNLVRYMKSAWSVTLCGPNGDPQVAVGVSDTRSGARYVGADYLLADIDSISQMHSRIGIPRAWEGGVLPSAEAVAGAFYAGTGVPIMRVPRPQIHWAPLMRIPSLPLWEIAPAVTVMARLENGDMTGPLTRIYARIFAGDSLGFYVPAASQPTQVWVPFPISLDPFIVDSVAIGVLQPIAFRRVHFP